MNKLLKICCVSWVFLGWVGSPASWAQEEVPGEGREGLERYVDYLNELTERRRMNVFFANQQTPTYGAQVSYVNVGRGNLTFARRDLVVVGRMPLVAARIYDSSLGAGADFGAGWRLGLAETLEPQPDGSLLWRDESGSVTRYRKGWDLAAASALVPDPPHPSDLATLRLLPKDAIELRLKSGLRKIFQRSGDRFVLARVENRGGHGLRLEYTAGRLWRISDGDGRFIRFERDAAGRIVALEDDLGRRVSYRYDALGRLVEVTDIGGYAWTYGYDPAGRLSMSVDPLASPGFEVSYDGQGRVVALSAAGHGYGYTYSGLETTVTDAAGNQSLYRQNAAGLTVFVRNSMGEESRLVMDKGNRPWQLYRGGQLRAEMRYDRVGQLRTLTRHDADLPHPQTFVYTYDEGGLLTRVWQQGADLVGGETLLELGYDEQGRLTSKQDAASSTFYAYSEAGDLEEIVQPGESFFRFTHNAAGQIASVTDQQGRWTGFEYRPDGRLAATHYPDGSSNSYDYNPLGMRKRVDLGSGGYVEYQHNPTGSLTEVRVTNEDGSIRGHRVVLDGEQKIVGIDYFDRGMVAIEYDDMGNAAQASNGDERLVFRYDALSRLVAVETVDGETLTYEYAEGEPDLRLQMDWKTGQGLAGQMTAGSSFGGLLEMVYHRTRQSGYGPVHLDPSSGAFQLSATLGWPLPDRLALGALDRLRMLRIGAGEMMEQMGFEQPSNVVFLPAEYRTVNCCIECEFFRFCECGGYGHYDYNDHCSNCFPHIPPPPLPCSFNIDLANTFNISTTPAMPTMTARATNINPSNATISWSARINFTSSGGCSGSTFNSPNRTGTGTTFTPNFNGFYGGTLNVTATCSAPGRTSTSRSDSATVNGREPSKASIRARIGNTGAPFQADDLKRIACQESNQRQFAANPGQPLLGAGGDAGIMQICFGRTAADFWNWHTNIASGRNILNSSRNRADQMPGRVRTVVVRGMGPFPAATNFTNAQRRLEAIHRYNAGTALNLGYWEWNNALGVWVARPQGGVGGYAQSVIGRSPNC